MYKITLWNYTLYHKITTKESKYHGFFTTSLFQINFSVDALLKRETIKKGGNQILSKIMPIRFMRPIRNQIKFQKCYWLPPVFTNKCDQNTYNYLGN